MSDKPLPTSIVVGPFTYKVIVGGDAHHNACMSRSSDLYGCADHVSLTISLKPGMPHDALCETLIHEVLHACLNAVGQPLGSMTNEDVEENAVRVTAPPLLQVLRANPKLVAFLSA